MKHALHLLGLGLMVMLLGAGYAPQGPQQLRSRWARADTDTVRQRIAFVGADSVVGFSDGGQIHAAVHRECACYPGQYAVVCGVGEAPCG